MTSTFIVAAAFLALIAALHVGTNILALTRCRLRTRPASPSEGAPAVSIVRPVCGLDNFLEATLASSFYLDYPDYEVIFCVAQARDPAVPVVQRLIDAHPQVRARLIVGDERISANPKLNNCFKGWNAATHDWIVLADSNVLMPRDYLSRLMAAWRADTGLVCSPPVGTAPDGFWAHVECAFLNAHQARWQYLAATVTAGFAQGKTMLWRRDILDAAGGIRVLGREAAEDAAATKVMRAAGLRVRLVDPPFPQPLGHRTAVDVWNRQVRWAQLRRASFPHLYAPEIFCGLLWPLVACAVAATEAGLPLLPSLTACAALWYGTEMALARGAGWPAPLAYPLHAAIRDLMLPALWVYGWVGSSFVWRGNAMSADVTSETPIHET